MKAPLLAAEIFTQSLVDALEIEYERNNVIVSDSTARELQVSVTNIEMYLGGMIFRADIFSEVKYENGPIEKFDVTRIIYAFLLITKRKIY